MAVLRQNDATTPHRDRASPNVAGSIPVRGEPAPNPNAAPGDPRASGDPQPDPTTDDDAPPLEVRLSGPSHSRAVVMTLLLTMAATPFLKGILAGFALAGAAAAVRGALGA